MGRIENFEAMAVHQIQGKLFKKLKKDELQMCRDFINENESLDANAFCEKANRWLVDGARPKNYSTMWALVIQSQPSTPIRRRG